MLMRDLTFGDMAQLIERFLEDRSLYPQEWNDFVDTPQRDSNRDVYRRRCYELDPLVNLPEKADPEAVSELRDMVRKLRLDSTLWDAS
jgi:hypothetical protein